jgi:hypothetical protein
MSEHRIIVTQYGYGRVEDDGRVTEGRLRTDDEGAVRWVAGPPPYGTSIEATGPMEPEGGQ